MHADKTVATSDRCDGSGTRNNEEKEQAVYCFLFTLEQESLHLFFSFLAICMLVARRIASPFNLKIPWSATKMRERKGTWHFSSARSAERSDLANR